MGVPLSLAGRVALPVPHPIAQSIGAALWIAQLVEAPPSFYKYLRFLCVADGQKARAKMGFRPVWSVSQTTRGFVRCGFFGSQSQ